MHAMFPILGERSATRAGSLSGGEQQMCAIARGLMSRPRILLLDEPSLGLSPILVAQIFEIIRDINTRGTTVLLVEQNAHMALSIAHRGYVIATGEITLEGTGQELLGNEMVKKLYLGEA
jgi:branched-chain amino acid transport system ATP-binding protein